MLRWVWIGFWVVMFVLTHVPKTPGGPPHVPHLDKVFHAGMFFGLTILAGAALRLRHRPDPAHTLLRWAVVFALYAALDEWTQQFVRRDPDVLDWLADIAGITLGVVVMQKWSTSRRPHVVNNP